MWDDDAGYDTNDPKVLMSKRRLTFFYRGVSWRGEDVHGLDRDNCWLWRGYLTYDGYGKFCDRGAHRIAYEHFIGRVPEGLQLDHLCRRRSCCNPWHLEPVTAAENIRRGHAARGTLGGRTNGRQVEAKRRYAARKRADRDRERSATNVG